MPARGCNVGSSRAAAFVARVFYERIFRFKCIARIEFGRSGILKCTAAIRARHGSFAFKADATVASPDMSRSIGGSPG